MSDKSNIVLIGMPASGKSTIGVLLAKALAMSFVDTDLLIQAKAGERLQQLQQQQGMDIFQSLECEVIASLDCDRTLIATGGSAVYCSHSMGLLAALGTIVFLNVPLAELESRIGDLSKRGVVMKPEMTLADLFAERMPLYQQYAEKQVDCAGKTPQQIAETLYCALVD